MTRAARLLLALTCSSVVCAWVATAEASSVAVTPFGGEKKKALRARLIAALEESGHSVVEADAPAGDDAKAYTALASDLGVVAIIGGDTVMKKSGWTLSLSVRSGSSGEVLTKEQIRAPWLPGLLKKIDKESGELLSTPIQEAEETAAASAASKAESEPEPVILSEDTSSEDTSAAPEADDGAREQSASDRAGSGPSALSLAATMSAFRRDLTYNQDVNGNLRPYELKRSPAATLAAGWYPGALFSSGAIADLGIIAHYERNFATSSELTSGGEQYDTTMQSYSVGLRYRLRVGDHELGVSGSFGGHEFEVAGDATSTTAAAGAPIARDYLPDVSYQFVRPGLDARLAFGKFGVGVYGGYRAVLSEGDIGGESWFPNATAQALDIGGYVSYDVLESLRMMIGGDYRRYGLDMNSNPDDLGQGRDVAGGAVDQYLAGFAGVEWRLSGSGKSD